MQLFR
jgi:hypothetical protein